MYTVDFAEAYVYQDKVGKLVMEVYTNARIIEAGLDIRVRLADPSNVDRLGQIRDPQYPELFGTPMNVQFTIEGDPHNVSGSASNTPLGFWYRTTDQKNVFQVRTDGFTHNRLSPYQDWSTFSQEARRLWLLYKEAANPLGVELVGLTYMNEFLLPVGKSFADHFRTYIEVPLELPQTITSFTMNYQVELEEGAGVLQISQGYGPPKKIDHVTVILNIQAFRVLNVALPEISEDELWNMMQQLRKAKDEAFEACITDNIRGMIR